MAHLLDQHQQDLDVAAAIVVIRGAAPAASAVDKRQQHLQTAQASAEPNRVAATALQAAQSDAWSHSRHGSSSAQHVTFADMVLTRSGIG